MRAIWAAVILGGSLMACTGQAVADPVEWAIPDLALVDGGIISGTFSYDADTATFSNIQVKTSGGGLPGVVYTRAQGGSEWQAPTWAVFRSSAPDSDIVKIVLANPMTNMGGSNAVIGVQAGSCSEACLGSFQTTRASQASGPISGTPTPTPTPVPTLSEWAMILLGVMLAGGAALTIQRRRQAA